MKKLLFEVANYINEIEKNYDNMNLNRNNRFLDAVGVLKKLKMQSDVLSKHFDTYVIGFFLNEQNETEIAIYNNNKINIIKTNKKKHRLLRLYEETFNYIKKNDIECFYSRYAMTNFYYLSMLKKICKIRKIKMLLEIHTYPYKKISIDTMKGKVSYLIDVLLRVQLKKYFDRIVTLTWDKKIYDIKCIHMQNGIDFSQFKMRKTNKLFRTDEVNLLNVSVLHKVNNINRIIEGMIDYNNAEVNVQFHIVGEGDKEYLEKLKTLVKENNLTENVIFYGRLLGEKLDEVYDKCDIGIGNLCGKNFDGIISNELKSREYLAKGLPIVMSLNSDAYNEKYFLKIPIGEEPININEIVDFYFKVYNNKEYKNTSEEIRNYSKSVCDINEAMKGIIDFYEN